MYFCISLEIWDRPQNDSILQVWWHWSRHNHSLPLASPCHFLSQCKICFCKVPWNVCKTDWGCTPTADLIAGCHNQGLQSLMWQTLNGPWDGNTQMQQNSSRIIKTMVVATPYVQSNQINSICPHSLVIHTQVPLMNGLTIKKSWKKNWCEKRADTYWERGSSTVLIHI